MCQEGIEESKIKDYMGNREDLLNELIFFRSKNERKVTMMISLFFNLNFLLS